MNILDELDDFINQTCIVKRNKKSQRIEIPIKNEFERQTHYRAYYYQTKEFIIQELKKWKY